MKISDKDTKCSYLPEGARVFYVGIDNDFMAQAKEIARLSNEQQQPVGVVIVHNGEIVAKAHNKTLLTNSFLIRLHQKFCIRHFLGVPTGKHYWICPGCASKKSHAEYQASKQILQKGIPGRPIDLYMWGHWACCNACCMAMVEVQVNNLYILRDGEKLFNPKHPANIIGKQFKL